MPSSDVINGPDQKLESVRKRFGAVWITVSHHDSTTALADAMHIVAVKSSHIYVAIL
jgi:hypothetical protein